MVWQVAFVGQNGLHALIVANVTEYGYTGSFPGPCCMECNIRDQSSAAKSWVVLENDLQEVMD